MYNSTFKFFDRDAFAGLKRIEEVHLLLSQHCSLMLFMTCVLDSNRFETFDMIFFSGLENLTRFYFTIILIFKSIPSHLISSQHLYCVFDSNKVKSFSEDAFHGFNKLQSLLISSSYCLPQYHSTSFHFNSFHFTPCSLLNHSSQWDSNHSLLTSSKTSQTSSHYIPFTSCFKRKLSVE